MKRMTVFLLIATLLVMLVACGGEGVESSSSPDVSEELTTTSSISATTSSASTTTSSTTAQSTASSTTTTTTTSSTTTTAPALINPEAPVTINGAPLFDGQHSRFDAQADKLRQSILNAKDTVKPSANGVTYYVSYKGNDENDGLSPETAWRSTERVGVASFIMRSGTTVLFERGGVYRGTMYARSGVSFGAYGVGPKPQLYGSPRNYADESLWKKTDNPNIWLLEFGNELGDVGNITFDYGVKHASVGKRLSLDKVKSDLDFYFDLDKGNVYLYYSKGNPGKLHKSIEITAKGKGAVIRRHLTASKTSNVTVDNLCIRYCNFGISFGVSENIKITNCEIGFIGGCMQTETVRYGNGIEFYGDVTNITVENNWIYQSYDAGYTDQGGTSHVNVQVRNNLIEYCHYNIEVFASAGGTGVKDSVYENNILRFAGYGFGSYNRTCEGLIKTAEQGGNIRTGTEGVPSDNFVIRNNIFDGGKFNVVYCGALSGANSPTFSGNTWVQSGTYDVYRYWDKGYKVKPGGSLQAMKDAILPLDPKATVYYE